MTSKGIVRYLIAVVIVYIILAIALPIAGIPHAVLLPPGVDYAQAGGTATGYITGKDTDPTANPFHVGDKDYFVYYQFKGPALPGFGQHLSDPSATAVYKQRAQVTQDFWNTAQINQTVPVKFDNSDPVIGGITSPGGGRNGNDGAALLSGWIGWEILMLVIAYPLAMLLERVILRESY